MKIRILSPVKADGLRFAPGEAADLADELAAELVSFGAAEPADGKPAKLPPASTPQAAGAASKPNPKTHGTNKVAAKKVSPKKQS
jgi:hypothetical protein